MNRDRDRNDRGRDDQGGSGPQRRDFRSGGAGGGRSNEGGRGPRGDAPRSGRPFGLPYPPRPPGGAGPRGFERGPGAGPQGFGGRPPQLGPRPGQGGGYGSSGGYGPTRRDEQGHGRDGERRGGGGRPPFPPKAPGFGRPPGRPPFPKPRPYGSNPFAEDDQREPRRDQRDDRGPRPPRSDRPGPGGPPRDSRWRENQRPGDQGRPSRPPVSRGPALSRPPSTGPVEDRPAPPVSRPSRPSNPRRVAVDILLEWQESGTYADALLATADQRHFFANPSDRGLLHALVLGVLRHKTMLDIWLSELNQRGRLTDPVRWILRLGLFQLLKMGVAQHAAVDESVNLTYDEKPLVNAILRRAIEEKDHLLAIEEDAPIHERYSLPDFLVERWRWLFGEEGMLKLVELMGQPAETFVRLNRLKPWTEVPVGLAPVEGMADFFRAADVPRAALEAGTCYVQDPSTWFACALLAPKPGQTVLDACAAPGGKAAILAQFMENQGTLVATDTSSRRLKRLSENLTRLGVTNAECRIADWTAEDVPDDGVRYDRILLDVPCSNTGVMRRRVDVRWRVTPAMVAEMVDVQWRILAATIPRLAPGGRLVYSTCSLEPAENEVQVDRVLATYPQLRLVEKKLVVPHETGFDGAFAALFELA